jgi:hypothetical protein
LVPFVPQDVERQLVLLDQVEAALGKLRRDGDKLGAGFAKLRNDFVQSIQLWIAVGSPVSAEE